MARAWIDRAGHPLVTAAARCNAGKTELVLSQTRDGGAATEQPWPVPVCARTASTASCALLRAATETRVVAPTCEPWVLANAESGGFYRVRYDAPALAALGRVAEKQLQPIERAGLVADAWALVRDGRAPLVSYLELVGDLRGEPNDNVVAEVRRRLMRVGHELVAPADRERWRGFVAEVFGGALDELGWQGRAGESVEVRQLRASLWEALGDAEVPRALDAAKRALPGYLANPASVDSTLGSTIVQLAARGGDAARWQTYRARMAAAPTPDERERFARALTDFQAPALVGDTLALSLSKEVRTQDAARLVTTSHGPPVVAAPGVGLRQDALARARGQGAREHADAHRRLGERLLRRRDARTRRSPSLATRSCPASSGASRSPRKRPRCASRGRRARRRRCRRGCTRAARSTRRASFAEGSKERSVPAQTPRPHRACVPWRRVKPSQSPPTAACSSSRAR